jgi:MotA/TolQ/ExbB proton channel family
MNPWQFLVPDDPIAVGVLVSLSVLFVVWLLFLIEESFRMRRQKAEIRNSTSVDILEDVLKRQIVLRQSEASAIEPEQRIAAKKQEEANFQVALEDFRTTVGINDRSIIGAHIRAIFEAGWNNSQLEIEPLIKNTATRLLHRNGLLRSILSLFIIIGLLGTLFGLAHSLAELSPLIPDGSQLTNTVAAQGLGKLLNRLKGAFAPSILGVGLTILGVLLFSFYLKACQSVIDELERLTLTVWVPRLYPNPFQQQVATLIQTEDLIRQNRAHIETVANFASHIKEDVEGFGTEIKKAKTTLADLNQSSSQINQFADSFARSIEKLAPFQDELSNLYSKMLEDSKVFQEGVTRSLLDTGKIQREAHEIILQQSIQLEKVIGQLRSYENAFVFSHQELNTVLNAVMLDARNAFQDIGRRNTEIIEAIDSSLSVPLRANLTGNFTTLNEILNAKLSSIVDRFGTFETPIKNSAQRFEQIVGTIDSRANELMARLQHEYQKQNEANVDQLQKLENLNQQLISSTATLSSVTSRQETSYAALSSALPSLQEKLIALNDNLRGVIVEGFPATAANSALDTSGLEKQIKENTTKLLTELNKLVCIGDDIKTLQSRNGLPKEQHSFSPVIVTAQPAQTISQANTVEENHSSRLSRLGIRARITTIWKKIRRSKR